MRSFKGQARVPQEAVGTLGGREAGVDCVQAIAALVATPPSDSDFSSPQDGALVEALQRSLISAGGLEHLVRIAGSKGPPAKAGNAASAMLSMWQSLGSGIRISFEGLGGIAAMVRVMTNPYVDLHHRAAAAGNLWYYMVPESQSLYTDGKRARLKLKAPGAAEAEASGPAAPEGALQVRPLLHYSELYVNVWPRKYAGGRCFQDM
jgi:hypothetical protein